MNDLINALFEALGSIFTWMNVWRVWKDGGYAGVYVPAVAFFLSWGLWNIYYYNSLGQTWSWWAGLSLAVANVAWVGSMFILGRVKGGT